VDSTVPEQPAVRDQPIHSAVHPVDSRADDGAGTPGEPGEPGEPAARAAVDRLLDAARAEIAPRAHPGEVAGVLAGGGLLVDTRPVELRRRDGHMPGAVVVDRNVLEWRLDPTSPHRLPQVTGPDQRIVLFCDEGYASSLAAATLRRLGLRRATDLAGGYQAWRRQGGGGAGVNPS
jgi:rhodanese-related sulfurtransferase